jgi:hypothetical protein
LVDPEVNESTVLFEDHLAKSSVSISSDLEEKNQMKMLVISQKLQRVPDLLANGDYEQALLDLSAYQTESLSILTEMEEVPMEEREEMVSALLDQKLEDIQLLRVIASMPEISGDVNIDEQMLEQMSIMVLSLKEEQLSDLSAFFESTDYAVDVQYNVYTRLKNDVDIGEELTEQFESVEDEIESSMSDMEEPMVEIMEVAEEVEEVDSSTHDADAGDETTSNP